VVGRGASRDRGSMTNPDMDMTTNTENELDVNSRAGKKKRKVRGQIE
jgi:ribosome assembly protein YihI (activator of Der GTPase)